MKFLDESGLKTLVDNIKSITDKKKDILIDEKTYENIYINSTSTNGNCNYLYNGFATVKPTNYATSWHVKLRVEASYVVSNKTYNQQNDVDIYGYGNSTSIAYACFNAMTSTSYRPYTYIYVFKPADETQFDNGFDYRLEFNGSSSNSVTTHYSRRINVKLIEADGCTVTLLDELSINDYQNYYYNDLETCKTNKASYGYWIYSSSTSQSFQSSSIDTANNGLQETGDANNYERLCDTYYRPYAGSAIYAYKLCMRGVDNRLYPIVTTSGNGTNKAVQTVALRPDNIWYFSQNSTINAGALTSAGYLYRDYPITTPHYTFNENIATYRDVYLCGDYNAETGLFTLATTNAEGATSVTSFYVQVPTNTASVNYVDYFISGRYYIFVGSSYSSANYMQLMDIHTLYYFDGTNLVPVIAKAEIAETAKSLDSSASVPASQITGLSTMISATEVTSAKTAGVANTIASTATVQGSQVNGAVASASTADSVAWANVTNKTTASTTANGIMTSAMVTTLNNTSTALNTHTSNTTVHITSEERTAWNAVSSKAPLASPALTGTPTAPKADGSNTSAIANVAYVTDYVSAQINSQLAANDAMIFKGTIGTGGTVTALPNTHNAGWTYKVITAGKYANIQCEVGDMIICISDGTAANNAHWTVVQTNIDGAVTGPTSATSGNIALFDGATGKLIKDSGVKPYVHTSAHTSAALGLYKIEVNTSGHVTSTSAVTKTDITGLGIPSENTTYNAATTAGDGLMTSSMVSTLNALNTKVSGIASGATSNTTMVGATSTANGSSGLVPAPTSGNRAQFLRGDGTWATPANTTYNAATTATSGLMTSTMVSTLNAISAKVGGIASGATSNSISFNRSLASGTKIGTITIDGTGTDIYCETNTNTTYGNMVGAQASAAGSAGLVPAPGSGKNLSFLRGDGSWVVPTNTTYNNATTAADGLMTSAMVSKLNAIDTKVSGIASGATSNTVMTGANANAAGTSGLVPAPAKGDQAKFLRADGSWIVPTNTTYNVATTATSGLMSATDKTNLDAVVTKVSGIATGATSVSVSRVVSTGTKIATISVNGTGTDLYCQTDTDTKNTAGSTATTSKIFLVGATSQAANPQTYSDANVYATNGTLRSTKLNVNDKVTLEYNATTESLDFLFI